MRLLQVCNVGNIVGGTAACAWTVTRALPHMEHAVVFLSSVTEETRQAFADCRVEQWERVDDERLSALQPDVVLLHNTAERCVGRISSAVRVQYVHSVGRRAEADLTLYCSRWLANRCGGQAADVLYQAVPQPSPPVGGETRGLRERLVIGRICTPQPQKWPADLRGFYRRLARRFPEVDWEFVGCPVSMQPVLIDACGGRAAFHPASWRARALLWRWDALLYHNPNVTESFGRTAAESMRAGCIPVVDNRGGFTEQVNPAGGFLCGGDEDFAAAVDRLRDAGMRRRMSRAALAHANEAFALARFRAEFHRMLSTLLQ
jgi:hypothetical protein